jgi:hypothetical protein
VSKWNLSNKRSLDLALAFAWQDAGGERLLMAVNYAPNQSQCYVRLPFTDLGGCQWRLEDRLGGAVYDRDGTDLQSRGLYLDIVPWQACVFSLKAHVEESRPIPQRPQKALPDDSPRPVAVASAAATGVGQAKQAKTSGRA